MMVGSVCSSLGDEGREPQAVDEHLRDARALLGPAGLLLDDRRQHRRSCGRRSPASSCSSAPPLAWAARSSLEDLAVAAHQRDQRARRRAARAQPVGVGEEVALQRVARQAQLRGERRDRSPWRPARALPAMPAASRMSATSTRFLPSGYHDRDQLVGGALHQRVEDLLRRRGRVDLVAAGLEPPGDAALAGVEAEDRRPLPISPACQQVGDVTGAGAVRDLDRRPCRCAVPPGVSP